MILLIGSLQLGLLYSIMVMGIYLSFRILNIPDLTAEGSFTFGVATAALLAVSGHPILGLVLAALAGGAAGCVTGLLQTKLGIHPVLTGILTMSGLYSVNTAVLGGSPNLSLIGKNTIFTMAAQTLPGLGKEGARLLTAAVFAAALVFILTVFFKTRLGLSIRATGDNVEMVKASSINVDRMKIVALALGNALIALCGGLIAQYQSFADINSGVGILVVGLASVVIGEAFFGRRSLALGFLSAVFGSVVYRYIIALATKADWFPAYMLKLVSAVIVVLALAIPAIRSWKERSDIRRKGRVHGSHA